MSIRRRRQSLSDTFFWWFVFFATFFVILYFYTYNIHIIPATTTTFSERRVCVFVSSFFHLWWINRLYLAAVSMADKLNWIRRWYSSYRIHFREHHHWRGRRKKRLLHHRRNRGTLCQWSGLQFMNLWRRERIIDDCVTRLQEGRYYFARDLGWPCPPSWASFVKF